MRDKLIPVLWLMLASIIIGASVGFAARADANPMDELAVAICEHYDAVGPTRGATVRMASKMFDAGLDSGQAAAMFALAVADYCPEYLSDVTEVMGDLEAGR